MKDNQELSKEIRIIEESSYKWETFLESPSPLPGSDSVPVTDVARSVLAGLSAVATHKDSTNQLYISELLYWDSLHLNYATGSKTILQTILLNSCSSDVISSSVVRRVCTLVENHTSHGPKYFQIHQLKS